MGDCKRLGYLLLLVLLAACASGEDPYRFFTWNVTYGDIYPLGVKQQVHFLLLVLISCTKFSGFSVFLVLHHFIW